MEDVMEVMKFKTGRTRLPKLGIRVTLKPNQYFKNYGPVEDMRQFRENLCEIFDTNYDPDYKDEEVLGMQLYLTTDTGYELSIIYCDQNTEDETFILGHEATHTICALGLEHKLVEALKKEGLDFDPFEFYDDEEDIANVGGIFASYLEYKRYAEDFSDLMDLRYFTMAHMEKDDIAVEEGLFDDYLIP